MVHEDHGLCRRAARRARSHAGLARFGQDDAAQLDRQIRGRGADLRRRRRRRAVDRVYDTAGHPVRRDLHGGCRRASAGREGRSDEPRDRRVHRGVQADRRGRGDAGDDGEKGHGARYLGRSSADG